MPLTQGLRSSWGRRRSPLPLIPWRHHGSRPGEAQSEEAACRGWAVTSLGWRPACCVGPRDPAAPLGLAGGGQPWRPGLHRLIARGRGTAVRRGLAGVPLPSPPCGAAGWLPPLLLPPLPGVRVPLLEPAVTPSWASHPLLVPGQQRGMGGGGCCRALLDWGEKSGRGLAYRLEAGRGRAAVPPKSAETKQPIKVLHVVHTRVSLEAGRGRAAGPPPYAFPLVYTPRGKDPRQRLRSPPHWPVRGLCRGRGDLPLVR